MEVEVEYRTDLALESFKLGKLHDEKGIAFKQSEGTNTVVTEIKVLDEEGAGKLGKPIGNYFTLESDNLIGNIDISELNDVKNEFVGALSEVLKELIHFNSHLKVLVVGLGNEEVTPDSLGPITVKNVKATRHIFEMFNCDEDEGLSNVACICPNVKGVTGIEGADIIKQIVDMIMPDILIVVDSLAAKDIKRICSTVQVCDTGIMPGAGVGNHRKAINEESVGIKVIAIGVPTVIDGKTLVMDTVKDGITTAENVEKYLKDKDMDMIVTSTDIDEVIKEFSKIISQAINIVLHPGIY